MKIYFSIFFTLTAMVLCGCSKGGSNSETPSGGDEDKQESYVYGYFPDEVKAPLVGQIFAGAYYRKVVSSSDVWTGIEGTVILPHMAPKPLLQILINASGRKSIIYGKKNLCDYNISK